MSFFYPNESKFIEGKIEFNYPEKTINKRDIKEKLNYQQTMRKPNQYLELEGELIDIKDKYYEVQYTDREFQFQDLKMKSGDFHTKKMYVYGLLHHNISQYSNKNIVGEIVIEHENLSPRKSNVYTCFLLQNNEKNVENSLDKLLQLIKNKDNNKVDIFEEKISLNKVIPQQKEVIYYENINPGKKQHIYIFLEPISVNNDSSEFLKTLTYKTDLFEVNAPMDKKFFSVDFTPKSDREGFTSMFSSVREGYDGYYLDCRPAGESKDTTPGYVAPIASEFTKSKGTVDGLTILVDLLLFFLLVMTVFFCAPSLYKYTLINPVVASHGESGADNIYKTIAGLDIIVLLLNVVIFVLFLVGAAYQMNSFFIFGISWLLVTIFSVLTIMMNKGNKSFWSFNKINIDPPENDEHNIGNFRSIIMDILSSGDLLKEPSKIMGISPFLFALAVGAVITILIITPVSITNNMKPVQITVATLLGIFFSSLIAVPVRTFYTPSSESESDSS